MDRVKKRFEKIKDYDWKKLLLELLVVFLGVTAGFILNNWQEQRKNTLLETEYIHGFLGDVNTTIEKLNSSIESDSLWMKRVRPLLTEIREETIKIDSAEAAVRLITVISKLETQNSTYENITNSGSFSIISNYNLRIQITEYQAKINEVKYIDDYFNKYFGDFVVPFIYSNVNVLTGKIVNPGAVKTPQFANSVAGYYSLVQQRKTVYTSMLTKSYEFKKNLEEVLGKQ